MANPLGSGVTRYINGRDKQLGSVIIQSNKPILDSELNLAQFVDLEARAEEVRSRVPSGWLINEANPMNDFVTHPNYSNLFFFGNQHVNELRDLQWAIVNGWPIPVTATRTGAPPLSPNNFDTWNRIELNPPGGATGGNKVEFIFLEAWLQRIDVDPAPPTIAPGKPQRGFLYRFGNVESGYSYLPDDLIDPDMNFETSKRIQIQYRIRVIQNINLSQYPEGFDPTLVFAQGPLSTPSALYFTNMRKELGDPGLWRAGTGDSDLVGTVDGYIYAIPISAVFRRNSAGFSDTGNLAGAFNRNSTATTREDAIVYSSGLTLPTDIADTDTQFTLTTISGTVLENMSSFGEAYFRVDDEIIRISNINQTSPTSFVITFDRGQLLTTIRAHSAGKALNLYTVRPDGLFADQVARTDILDLRHSVADKFDYDSILKTNLVELLKGNLRTAWKRFGSTNTAGPVVLYGDRITDDSIFVGGLSRLDGPNGNRRTWSDAITTERLVVSCRNPSDSNAIGDDLEVSVAPYNIIVEWSNADATRLPGSRIDSGVSKWFNGDKIKINLAEFQDGLPVTDADQVRFITPDEDEDAVLIHFEGMISDPNGANPSVAPYSTCPSVTLPVFSSAPTGNRILKHGQGITVTVDGSGNLEIELDSGTSGTVFQEFQDCLDNLDTITSDTAAASLMHIQVGVVYGSGRGLSHKPDYVHNVHYRGDASNSSKVMLRPGLNNGNRMIPSYVSFSPYVQTGKHRDLAVTSEVMVDTGSKTIKVQPYRNVLLPPLIVRNGNVLNWGNLAQPQGAMPMYDEPRTTLVHTYVDPLDLFYIGNTNTRYVEIPWEYLPRPGLHHVPIIPVTGTVFPSGINFLLMSKTGSVGSTSDWNRNLVAYPSASPGYYVVTPVIGETYGDSSSSTSCFGQKYENEVLPTLSGPFRGIQFPPFYGPARITGVYLRDTTGALPYPTTPTSSPFNNNRQFVGGVGTDINLLKDDFDGPTFLLDVDANGDITFVLNADVIDLTKAPSGTTWDNSEFIVECTLFAFDRGFLQTNGRLLITQAKGQSLSVDLNTFIDNSDERTGIIAPAPLTLGATNNELTIFYSRQPYQGDVFGTRDAYSDDVQRLGPLTVSEATSIFSNHQGPINTLTLSNKTGFEVLAATNFVTSLGTGRLSGSNPIPLLTEEQKPDEVIDYAGTLVDFDRRFSLNRVGYEDWETPLFPVVEASVAARPDIELGAISEVYDRDVNTEFAGCISQLPLGIYFRDKDFIGKTLYQIRSANNIGAIPLGTLYFPPFESPVSALSPGQSTWEGVEFVCGQSSSASGVGGEALIKVDGTANYGSVTQFKAARGGAGWSVTNPWPGAAISAKLPKARPNSNAGAVLSGIAYLVRSQPETVNSIEVHPGNELQLLIVTQAAPTYFRDSDILHSASGTNEGYTAVDRYRIWGRPLVKRRGEIDVSSSVMPSPPPIFVNNIYDDPVFYGSSDVSLNSVAHGQLVVTSDGQTGFSLPSQPINQDAPMIWVRGVKLDKDTDYTISGATNQTLTYIPSFPDNTELEVDDVLEYYYLRI